MVSGTTDFRISFSLAIMCFTRKLEASVMLRFSLHLEREKEHTLNFFLTTSFQNVRFDISGRRLCLISSPIELDLGTVMNY